MKITCISDLHGENPELPGGDLLIVAGDLTAGNRLPEYVRFYAWLSRQRYTKKIVIAGNHDGMLTSGFPTNQKEADDVKEVQRFLVDSKEMHEPDYEYLCDSGTEFEGLKIWGSPWTPTFGNWYFMKHRGNEIREKWDLIPNDTDILVTHGPPYGILDKVERRRCVTVCCGCEELKKAVDRVKPRLHVFGHIHGAYGIEKRDNTTFVNCSHMDEDYDPVNRAVEIEL